MAEIDAKKYRIPLFNGTNFSNWKFRMETLLTEMDLVSCITQKYTEMVEILITDTTEQRTMKESKIRKKQKKDRKCKSNIIQRIADSHIEYARIRRRLLTCDLHFVKRSKGKVLLASY